MRKQIAAGQVAPIYLLLGADEVAKVGLAAAFLDLIEPDLRAFNTDRLYGGETDASAVVEAARTLPMMAPRRVVLLMHAERLLHPKKDSEASERELETFEAYVKSPVDTSCLVLVAEALDRRRSVTRLLMSRAVVVECTGPADVAEAAKWVRDRVAREGMTIDPRAARLVADRVGTDIARLQSDVERLVLYAGDRKSITEADVKEIVSVSVSHDDWAMTRAIERGAAGEALRELAHMIDSGGVPYMILGQLAWFVRTKVPASRAQSAVEAVFRTDLAIKSSAGEPRALLERLIVELCGR